MLKSLAIGLLTLTAAVSTAAFAGNHGWAPQGEGGQDGFLCWIAPWLCENHDHQGSGGPTAAPEIDPAEALAALTLLSGGLAVLRGRRSGR